MLFLFVYLVVCRLLRAEWAIVPLLKSQPGALKISALIEKTGTHTKFLMLYFCWWIIRLIVCAN
jgi:hypothetical protein